MKIDGISFAEAVERLADKYGVQLPREDGDVPAKPRGPQRSRLLDAHKHAQEFYADALTGPDAVVARQFLDARGFDRAAAPTLGVGFSPHAGEARSEQHTSDLQSLTRISSAALRMKLKQ